MLRAIIRHEATGLPAENLLNVADRRTIAKLAVAAGGSTTRLPTLSEYLDRQQLIESADAVREIVSRLATENYAPRLPQCVRSQLKMDVVSAARRPFSAAPGPSRSSIGL
jgi:hypothetical protein